MAQNGCSYKRTLAETLPLIVEAECDLVLICRVLYLLFQNGFFLLGFCFVTMAENFFSLLRQRGSAGNGDGVCFSSSYIFLSYHRFSHSSLLLFPVFYMLSDILYFLGCKYMEREREKDSIIQPNQDGMGDE